MTNSEQLRKLDEGVDAWNRWRDENSRLSPELSGAHLSRRDLRGFNFSRCSLAGSHLNHADLSGASLVRTNLSGSSLEGARLVSAKGTEANFDGSNLTNADFTEADLSYASLTQCHMVGVTLKFTNLSGADLSKSNLYTANLSSAVLVGGKLLWANLTGSDLRRTNLKRCDMTGVSLIDSDLEGADLRKANLRYARIIDSNADLADFSGSRVYGISVWSVTSSGTIETDLTITPPDEPTITVDSLEIAQFVYLLLNSSKLRRAIDTISAKVVLILGRFTQARLSILEQIRGSLRSSGYLPLLFNFGGPTTRDLTETISTLAHLARFVIADITDARSIPQELMAIVPNLPSVPVQPILAAGEAEYSMFEHFQRYPWVLDTILYTDREVLNEEVFAAIEAKVRAAAHRQS